MLTFLHPCVNASLVPLRSQGFSVFFLQKEGLLCPFTTQIRLATTGECYIHTNVQGAISPDHLRSPFTCLGGGGGVDCCGGDRGV